MSNVFEPLPGKMMVRMCGSSYLYCNGICSNCKQAKSKCTFTTGTARASQTVSDSTTTRVMGEAILNDGSIYMPN